jgi:hypothetical protein
MPPESIGQREAWRVAAGFLLAPLVPAALYSTVMVPFQLIWIVLLFAYVPVFVVGIPAYFLLRDCLRPRIVTLLLAGGMVAISPWLALMLLSGAEHASVGDCVTVLKGRTTWCGFKLHVAFLGKVFAFGVLGGAVFWLCAVSRASRLQSSPGAGA